MSAVNDLDLLKTVGQVAAPAGIAIGAFLFFARDVIAKNIFPVLTKERAYHVIVVLAVMAWSIALAGIGAWVYVEVNKDQVIEKPHRSFVSEYKTSLTFTIPECKTKKAKDIVLAPKRIYFPSEYVKDEDRHVPIAKISGASKDTVRESIEWISQFGDRVCRVFVFAGVDVHGSREYNLALAQRLAEVVKQNLVIGGINGALVDTMSFGEERAKELFVASAKSDLDRDFNNYADVGALLR